MNHHTRLLLSGAVLAGALAAQVVQLPDNHHLGESPTQNQASGTASFWAGATATGRRFQILYDASHFTGIGGVTGPITIRHVRFRGEDTEHNRGGQTYTGVTANLYRTTSSSAAALSATFATNLAPTTTTLLGTVVIPTLTVGAFVQDTAGDLPYYSLPSLGGTHTLRGYIQNRFTDRAAAHASVEYRVNLIPRGIAFTDTIRIERIGLGLFYDCGTVAEGIEDLHDGRYLDSYGFGFRIAFSREAVFRIDWGYSEDGVNFTLAFGNSF